jgi:hypothetical protein
MMGNQEDARNTGICRSTIYLMLRFRFVRFRYVWCPYVLETVVVMKPDNDVPGSGTTPLTISRLESAHTVCSGRE